MQGVSYAILEIFVATTTPINQQECLFIMPKQHWDKCYPF
jgi:hypothetical protein